MAERFGLPIKILLQTMNSEDIAEQKACDALKNEEYREYLEGKMMTDEQRNDALIKMLGG